MESSVDSIFLCQESRQALLQHVQKAQFAIEHPEDLEGASFNTPVIQNGVSSHFKNLVVWFETGSVFVCDTDEAI